MGVLGGGKIINMGLLDSFMMQLAKKVGPAYRAACGHRAYGLRYQDVLVETPVVVEAIRRLPPLEQELRTRRLKIANDCAIKLLQHLDITEVDAQLLGLLAVQRISENAELQRLLAHRRQTKRTAETLLTLRIIVLERDLGLHGLSELPFLHVQRVVQDGVHRRAYRIIRNLTHSALLWLLVAKKKSPM